MASSPSPIRRAGPRSSRCAAAVDGMWLLQGDGRRSNPVGRTSTRSSPDGTSAPRRSSRARSTAGPCPTTGISWDIPFEADGPALRAHGSSLDYELERRIEPTEHGLLLSYRARALGGPIPFLWAAHPLFVAPPGTRVELPGDVSTVIYTDHPGPRSCRGPRRSPPSIRTGASYPEVVQCSPIGRSPRRASCIPTAHA